MEQLNRRENRVLKELLSVAIVNDEIDREDRFTLDNIYEKVDELTLNRVENLNGNRLRELVYELMRDGAHVQGIDVETFCLENYNLEW
jgi:predicted RNA-binding protein (virulence factor B family)